VPRRGNDQREWCDRREWWNRNHLSSPIFVGQSAPPQRAGAADGNLIFSFILVRDRDVQHEYFLPRRTVCSAILSSMSFQSAPPQRAGVAEESRVNRRAGRPPLADSKISGLHKH